jgi:hypothetical protein
VLVERIAIGYKPVILSLSDPCNRRAIKGCVERGETISPDRGGEGQGIATGYSAIVRSFVMQRPVMSGIVMTLNDIGVLMGSDVLRAPGGPLPADPKEDVHLSAELVGLKTQADRLLGEWLAAGSSLVSSCWNDASAFFSTGLGTHYSHDAQISFMAGGVDVGLIDNQLNIDAAMYVAYAGSVLGPAAENVYLIVQLELLRSEGEIMLQSADPQMPPTINMNYYADPVDLKVKVAAMRRALDIMAHWPGADKLGAWIGRPELALDMVMSGENRRAMRCWKTSPCTSRTRRITLTAHAVSVVSSILDYVFLALKISVLRMPA